MKMVVAMRNFQANRRFEAIKKGAKCSFLIFLARLKDRFRFHVPDSS